jgi:transposase
VPRTRLRYPPEFRVKAVRLIRSSDKPLSQISRGLGVSEQCLCVRGQAGRLDEGRRDDGLTLLERYELDIDRGHAFTPCAIRVAI